MNPLLRIIRGVSRVLPLVSVCIAAAQSTDQGTALKSVQTQEEVVKLSPFEVSTNKDFGYRKSMSETTSRVAIPVVDNPQSVEIISGDMLKDFGVVDMWQAFRYSSSVAVFPNAVAQTNLFNLRGFQLPVYINGVGVPALGATYSRTMMDNIDRIEIAKGPVGLYYGVSTPNGVANFITKKPEFRQATTLDLSGGSFRYSRVGLDTQAVVSKKLGLAYRLISSFEDRNGRTDYQHGTDVFVAPSMTFRPNDKLEISAEYNYTKEKVPYANNVWSLAINPQYYKDYANPSAAILQYMKTTYGLATDADAQAKIVQRWGPGVTWATWLVNWYNDIYAMTGTQPYGWSGSTIDWWRISPRGDKYSWATTESNTDGYQYLVDVSAVLTPVTGLSIKYRWLQMQQNRAMIRELISPNGGLRPDGRFYTETLIAGTTYQPANINFSRNSTQQVDVSYEIKGLGMKHNFVAGLQYDHSYSQSGAATIDFTKAKAVKDANGNVVNDYSTGVAIPLTGQNAYAYWDPWSGNQLDPLYDVIGGNAFATTKTTTNYKAYYLSYRGSALNDRLNILAGIRSTTSVNLDRKDNTPTVGVIYEVMPGLHAFASWSKTLTFTSTLSVQGLGVLPSDNAHLLNNEKDKGLEVGVKSDWHNNTLSGTLSYYKDDRDAVVTADTVRGLNEPRNLLSDPNKLVIFYVNGGLQRAEGLESDLTWTPNRNLQVVYSLNYEWTAKVLTDPSLNPTQQGTQTWIHEKTLRLAGAPLWASKLVVKYNFTQGMLKNASVGGAIRYMDKWQSTNNAGFDIVIPTETMYDLFASYSTTVYGVPTMFRVNLINVGNVINDITRSNGFEGRLSMSFQF